MKTRTEFDLLPEVISVMAALSDALGAKKVIPENVIPVLSTLKSPIKHHQISFRYRPKLPKEQGGARSLFIISIGGPRMSGTWEFTPIEVVRVIEQIRTGQLKAPSA